MSFAALSLIVTTAVIAAAWMLMPRLASALVLFAKPVAVLLAVSGFALARLAPPAEGLSPLGQCVLGGGFVGMVLWVTEAIPMGLSALLVIGLLGLCPSLRVTDVAAGLAGEVTLFLIGVVALGAAVEASGLATRLARFLCRSSGRSPSRLFVQLIVGMPVLALLIPSAITRNAVLIPACREALNEMKLDKSSRAARAIMLALGVLNPLASSALLTGGTSSITAASLIGGFTWLGWFCAMAAPYYALLAGGALLLRLQVGSFEPAQVPTGPARKERLPLSRTEWKTIGVLVFTAALWMTDSLHGLSPAIPALLGATILLMPGVGVMTWKTFESRLSWGLILVVGASLSLAALMTKTGAANWIGQLALSVVAGGATAPLLLVIGLVVTVVLVHLAITNLAACIALLIPIASTMGASVGLNPVITGLVVTIAADAVILYPVQTASNLMAYETGSYDARDVARLGIGMFALTIAVVVLMIPFWSWVGIPLTRG